MIVLGFSGIANGTFYRKKYGLRFVGHDASVALVSGGELLFAAEEERFSRDKHTSEFPANAFRAALDHAGLTVGDLDAIAYPWSVSGRRLLDVFAHHSRRVPVLAGPSLALTGLRVVRDVMSPGRSARLFARATGVPLPPCTGVKHHLGHAACAYLTSPFEESAVLTIDGQGEDESASLSEWTGQSYRPIGAIRSPDSIGILYGMVTDFLGMRAGWDEYKVMAMAREGDPERFRQAFDRLVCLEPDGTYRTHRTAMVFRPGYCDRMLARFFQVPPRQPTAPVERIHFDLAAALQAKTREIVFHLLGHLRKHTASRNLCMAGGVALNSVINGEVLRSGLFDSVWVPPAPGDHGGALGAALFLASCTGSVKRPRSFTAFLGPGYDDRQLLQALESFERPSTWTRPVSLAMDVARALARQQIVGWFQGRMEYGPRALGHRSILASPADRAMRDRINDRIKHREGFRPFGCAVPQERAAEIFEVGGPSPFMQFVVPVRESWRARLGAVDFCGTCRIQTVAAEDEALLHELLFAFGDLTGAPVLLNTSFNACDDPIVCTPDDALRTWWRTELDILVLGPYLVRRGRG